MSAEPLIQLEKVTKNYRIGDETVRALAGVDLKVAEGEFIALVGPSGSGKSTMLHVIGGLDSPSSGGVIIAGSNLSQASDSQLSSYRNRSVGFVFQTFNLHPTLNALENVALPLVFSGIPHRQRLEAARQALEEVGLAARAEHRPNQLSGGERQRVSIARALVAGPKIILADEPTGNLDSKTGERIVELLLRLNRERGITTVLVTHDLDIAARAPRILSMRDGSIVDERRA
jgi:putative ABC transport system ATP-binding protein